MIRVEGRSALLERVFRFDLHALTGGHLVAFGFVFGLDFRIGPRFVFHAETDFRKEHRLFDGKDLEFMFAGFQIEAERFEEVAAIIVQIFHGPFRRFLRGGADFIAGGVKDGADLFRILPDAGESQVGRFIKGVGAIDHDFTFDFSALAFNREILEVDLVHRRLRNIDFVGDIGLVIFLELQAAIRGGFAMALVFFLLL